MPNNLNCAGKHLTVLKISCSSSQAADAAVAAAKVGQAESAEELEQFKERASAIQRKVAATGNVVQQVGQHTAVHLY